MTQVSCFLQIVISSLVFFSFLKKKIINAGENHKMQIDKKKERKIIRAKNKLKKQNNQEGLFQDETRISISTTSIP